MNAKVKQPSKQASKLINALYLKMFDKMIISSTEAARVGNGCSMFNVLNSVNTLSSYFRHHVALLDQHTIPLLAMSLPWPMLLKVGGL